MIRCLQLLEVCRLLKVPNHARVRRELRPLRRSRRSEGIFKEASNVLISSGRLWGGRLLSLECRRPLAEAEGILDLDTYDVTATGHILPNRECVHALTARRAYNREAAVERPDQGDGRALGGTNRRQQS